jgi:hypothetical protein
MEYRVADGRPVGLNAEFASSANCEGVDVPLYARHGERFEPAADCRGACLSCTEPACGVPDLAMGGHRGKRDFRLADYRRWSKGLGRGPGEARGNTEAREGHDA